MQITNVSVVENRHLVPVKGWDAVIKAITVFSNGYTRGAQETDRITADAFAESSGVLGLGMYMLGSVVAADKRSALVDRLLFEAGQSLERRTEFSKSFDYDGMGTPFFKTEVTIKKLGDDMYGIGLNAAYVGDAPEVGLAEHLGIPRALTAYTVEVETQPVADNRFEFDFDQVLRKLKPVLSTKINGKRLMEGMFRTSLHGESNPHFLLAEKDGLQIRIKPGSIERRFVYSKGKAERDTWSAKCRVLSGELARDYRNDDENAKAAPTLHIEVLAQDDENRLLYLAKPIWQPDLQDRANVLAYAIAAALR